MIEDKILIIPVQLNKPIKMVVERTNTKLEITPDYKIIIAQIIPIVQKLGIIPYKSWMDELFLEKEEVNPWN